MTENKTGDFAQNLPESRPVQSIPFAAQPTSESAFKSATNKNIAPVS